jgi:hypothetical protein
MIQKACVNPAQCPRVPRKELAQQQDQHQDEQDQTGRTATDPNESAEYGKK